VPRVVEDEFGDTVDRGESTSDALGRVLAARQTQLARQGVCNARISDPQVERWCSPNRAGRNILERCMKTFGLSARTRGRVLKLARTAADLDGEEEISDQHVSQAILLRCLDRRRLESVVGSENKSPETPAGGVSGD